MSDESQETKDPDSGTMSNLTDSVEVLNIQNAPKAPHLVRLLYPTPPMSHKSEPELEPVPSTSESIKFTDPSKTCDPDQPQAYEDQNTFNINLTESLTLFLEERKLIQLEKEWWKLTAYKLKLEQLENCIDEEYQREKGSLSRLEKWGQQIKILFQFHKTDSMRLAGLSLAKRLKVIRLECESLEARMKAQKQLVLLLQEESSNPTENKTEHTEVSIDPEEDSYDENDNYGGESRDEKENSYKDGATGEFGGNIGINDAHKDPKM